MRGLVQKANIITPNFTEAAFLLGNLTIQVMQGRLQFGIRLVGHPLVAGLHGEHTIEARGLQGFPLGLELFEGHGQHSRPAGGWRYQR